MDKVEYQVKLKEITNMVEEQDYKGAMAVADTIDWKRVKSARTLGMIAEIYNANDRLDDSKKMLMMAYDHSATGKTILYRLTELCIKKGDLDEAVDCYTEFAEVAPNDSSKYVLKYKLYKARKAPVEDQISILEEYKEREYTERYSYELAKLYYKAGMKNKCVETCDDLILWFSEGKYVTKAMELKMQITPLSPSQREKYQNRYKVNDVENVLQEGRQEAEEYIEGAVAPIKKPKAQTYTPSNGQLAQSIRTVFSGIQQPEEEEQEASIGTESGMSEIDGKEDLSGYEVKDLEPENIHKQVDIPEKASEEIRDQIAGQMSLRDLKKGSDADLEDLFAETRQSLAQEVSEGDYIKTDASYEEKIAAQRRAEQESTKAKMQYAQETDESLGLTREFNFHHALQEAMKNGEQVQVDAIEKERMRPTIETIQADTEQKAAAETESPLEGLKTEDQPAAAISEPEAEDRLAAMTSEPEAEDQPMADIEEIPQTAAEEEKDLTSEEVIFAHADATPDTIDVVSEEPRKLTDIEKKIFTYFAPIPGMGEQITVALNKLHNNAGDKTSKTANILLTGRQGSGKTRLSDGIICAACKDLDIQAVRIAKIDASEFNQKDPVKIVDKLTGGFLVIESAGDMDDDKIEKLSHAMEFRTDGLTVMLEDEKSDLKDMLGRHPEFAEKFTSSVAIPVFTNDELVAFAKTYTKEQGYKMDELGVLALYTIIGDNQNDDKPIMVADVKDLLDQAIASANKGGRRLSRKFSKAAYDDEGRIILREKDFDFYDF